MNPSYTTPASIEKEAKKILNKSLRQIMEEDGVSTREIEEKLQQYENRGKGLLGELVEEFVFGLDVNNRAEADFMPVGIELKTNPIKNHTTKTFVSKERLVFSMINYDEIVNETWETSLFLKKDKMLLLSKK